MNVNEIANKIAFKEFEYLSDEDFSTKAIETDMYSFFEFIDYFEIKYQNSYWFWTDIILNSKIPVIDLFKRYRRRLMNYAVEYKLRIWRKNSFYVMGDKAERERLDRVLKYCTFYERHTNHFI